MTGFDLSALGGFDPMSMQREVMQAMSSGMNGTQDPQRIAPVPGRSPELPTKDGPDFAGFLADSIQNVQAMQEDSRDKARGLALGEDVDLHDVMIASSKSEVAFNLLIEVRNKMVDAWEKLSRSVM